MSDSRPFAAKFAGRCHAGDRIDVGDEVQFVNTPRAEQSVLVHVGCAEQVDQSSPPADSAPYCPACFCFHHGEC